VAPVARDIVLRPCIEFKAVEGDSLYADGNVRELRTDVPIEAIFVHAEIARRVS
jgi:hypothetical protein